MKLRALFDKLTPGMLDADVTVRVIANAGDGQDEVEMVGVAEVVSFNEDGTIIITAFHAETDLRGG